MSQLRRSLPLIWENTLCPNFVGSCHSHGRTKWSSLILTFAWPVPGHCIHLGNDPVNGKLWLSLSLSSVLPFKIITLFLNICLPHYLRCHLVYPHVISEHWGGMVPSALFCFSFLLMHSMESSKWWAKYLHLCRTPRRVRWRFELWALAWPSPSYCSRLESELIVPSLSLCLSNKLN